MSFIKEVYKSIVYNGVTATLRKVENRIRNQYNDYVKNERFYTFEEMQERIEKYEYKPLISMLIPIYKPNIFELQKLVQSVLEQPYEEIQVCFVDDGSNMLWLDKYAEELKEIHQEKVIWKKNKKNNGIAYVTNEALQLATGEYIALVDQDDVLAIPAMYEIVTVLQEKKYDFIYSDEDMIDEDGKRFNPQFKPDWSPHTLLSMMYVNHLSVYKKEILKKTGKFSSEFLGSQDYNMLLRASSHFNSVRHIDKILYHWRTSEQSIATSVENKEYIFQSGKSVVRDYLDNQGFNAEVNNRNGLLMYDIDADIKKELLVSVVVYGNSDEAILKTIASLIEYGGISISEFVFVASCTLKTTTKYLEREQISFQQVNQVALKKLQGEYILIIDENVTYFQENTLYKMIGIAQLPFSGVVSTTIIDNKNTILVAGAIQTTNGILASGYGSDINNIGYYGRNHFLYNFSYLVTNVVIEKEKITDEMQLETSSVEKVVTQLCAEISSIGLYNVNNGSIQVRYQNKKSFDVLLAGVNESISESEQKMPKYDKFYNENFKQSKGCLYQINNKIVGDE